MSAATQAGTVVPAGNASKFFDIRLQGDGGFDQCWYPLMLSSEVTPGAVHGVGFLDGKVVIYRTDDGAAHVLSAYCRHLGADLSVGAVVNNDVRCPFHYWQYGADGVCTKTAAGDPPPPGARLYAYATAESLGIVWAFNGETPTYPVPAFDVPESDLVLRSYRNPHPLPIDAPILFLNTFDLQHFTAVHGMNIDFDQQEIVRDGPTMRYVFRADTPEFGPVVQHRRIWGTNGLTLETKFRDRPLYMAHVLLQAPGPTTLGFLVNATPVARDADEAAVVDEVLRGAEVYSLRLVGEDVPMMKTIRFRPDQLTRSDRMLVQGMRWIKDFPRGHPAAQLIK